MARSCRVADFRGSTRCHLWKHTQFHFALGGGNDHLETRFDRGYPPTRGYEPAGLNWWRSEPPHYRGSRLLRSQGILQELQSVWLVCWHKEVREDSNQSRWLKWLPESSRNRGHRVEFRPGSSLRRTRADRKEILEVGGVLPSPFHWWIEKWPHVRNHSETNHRWPRKHHCRRPRGKT